MVPVGRIDKHDLDVLRLLVRGSSVVDWYRLHFQDRAEIDAFIRVNELDPARDHERLMELKDGSIRYLKEHLRYRVPELIQHADDLRILFEYASGKGRRAHRFHACLVLKVMHMLHYVEAHELLQMLPISNQELGILLQAKVENVVRGLLERNFPIYEFSGNTKTDYSVISKLLAKKNTQAAQLFDKLRFRIVAERREDILPLLIALMRELAPFNYLVPSQADNTLIDVDHMLVRAGNLAAIRDQKGESAALNEPFTDGLAEAGRNELSGPGYRVVNFVAEVPLRIDNVLSVSSARLRGLGPVVFGMIEFQVVDKEAAKVNESGQNKHTLYKARQLLKVKERLERGKRKKSQAPRDRDTS